MGAPELLALSLGVSVAVAALAWAGGRLVERLSADPRLRDRVWAAALILSALPPVAIGLLLLSPVPVRDLPVAPAALPTAVITAPAGITAAAPPPVFAVDPALVAWVVLGIAGLLAAARLGALTLRAWRLDRVVRQARAPDPAVTAMVEIAARDLAVRTPQIGVSDATSEALLASLGRARLILPGRFGNGADAVTASAVIAHELAHLKRGDHRALWLEEALLVLLAINPLMPVLRARRAAAREEACDALALGNAGPDARRAYARSLIEALRDRAGPQASSGLPALTFTGAGRNTAMSRLKAVLDPVPAAGRGSRLMALGLGGLIAVLAGAGSLAVAAEREAVLRAQPAPAAADEQPRTIDLGTGSRTLLNGEPLPEGLPMWAVAPERIDVRTPPAGSGEINFILPFTGSTPVSVNGRRMPAGFPAGGVNPDAVERVRIVDDHVMYTLKPEAEVRRTRTDAPSGEAAAPIAGPGTARSTLTPEQQARYDGLSAAGYREVCASDDVADGGFCAGVMFNVLGRAPQNGVCVPAAVQGTGADNGADLNAFVIRGKLEMARLAPRRDEGAFEYAGRALKRAYPCASAAEPVRMPVSLDYGPQPPTLLPGETLTLQLRGQSAAAHLAVEVGVTADADGRLPGMVSLPLTADYFPTSGRANTFDLSARIGVGQTARLTTDRTTVRLGPGSEYSTSRLAPILYFE